MKGALGNLMKQAQKMQEQVQRVQEEIANAEVVGESGGGLVRVIMNGRHDIKSVTIDPDLMNDEKTMIEDLMAAAVNDAAVRVGKIGSSNRYKPEYSPGIESTTPVC